VQKLKATDFKTDALIAYVATKHDREYWHSAKFKGFITTDADKAVIEFVDGRKRVIAVSQIRSIKHGDFWDEETYAKFLESKVVADANTHKQQSNKE